MIKYMIIEDEYILGYRLERMIASIRPSWQLACRTAGVEESAEALRTHEVDLIFMDIELSDGNCFELLDSTQIRQPVIFTTAYDEYALQAFKTDCIDYLLKPIGKDDLLRAIEKLERLKGSGQWQVPDYSSLGEHMRSAQAKNRILIPEGSGFIIVDTSDAAHFLRNDRYTDITTFSGKKHLVDKSLDSLEDELDRASFFRTSRNSIVNIKSIVSIQRFSNGRLRLTTNPPAETDIIVSQARRGDFLNWIEGII